MITAAADDGDDDDDTTIFSTLFTAVIEGLNDGLTSNYR